MPVRCKLCKITLPDDTNKKLVYCKCKKVAVDGCKEYTRIIGNLGDYDSI